MSQGKTTIVTVQGANGRTITCRTKYPSRTAKLAHRRAQASTLEGMASVMRKCEVGRRALTNAKGVFDKLQEEMDKLIEEDRTRAFEVEPMNIEIEEAERSGMIRSFQAIIDTTSISAPSDIDAIMSDPNGSFWGELEDLGAVQSALTFFRSAAIEGLQRGRDDGQGVADIPQVENPSIAGQSDAIPQPQEEASV